jgi:hypothetical protein
MTFCPTLSLTLLRAIAAGAGQAKTLATTDQINAAIAGNTVQGCMSASGPDTEFYAKDGTIKGNGCPGKWMAEGEGMCFFYGENWDCRVCGLTGPRSPG